MLFCVEVIPKVSVAINHKWKFIGWWKAIILWAISGIKKKAASAVHSHSLFDECAFKTVQFGWEEEKQQCDLNYCKCNMSWK